MAKADYSVINPTGRSGIPRYGDACTGSHPARSLSTADASSDRDRYVLVDQRHDRFARALPRPPSAVAARIACLQ
jgi:hypothetical protein